MKTPIIRQVVINSLLGGLICAILQTLGCTISSWQFWGIFVIFFGGYLNGLIK
jgi:hypothetical protein